MREPNFLTTTTPTLGLLLDKPLHLDHGTFQNERATDRRAIARGPSGADSDKGLNRALFHLGISNHISSERVVRLGRHPECW
jgi:hypothetical protein